MEVHPTAMRLVHWFAFTAIVVTAGPALADAPPHLFSDKDLGDETGVPKKVAAEIDAAKAGKPRTIVLDANTTDQWGCDCAPFVYAPFSTSAPDEKTAFFYPMVGKGPDPAAFSLVAESAATYQFTGHFTTDRLTRAEWMKKHKLKGGAPSAETTEGAKLKQPVFAVDSWCMALAADPGETAKPYLPILAKMKKAGVPTCGK
jgi:hypothetical protein